MLKSAVIEKKKLKHTPWARAPISVNRKASSLWSFVANLKRVSLTLTLYISFHDLINVYCHRAGADNPRGQNFDETSCHFGHLLQVSKKLWSDFIHFFFFFFFFFFMILFYTCV